MPNDDDDADLVKLGGPGLVNYRLRKIEEAVGALQISFTTQIGNLLEHTVSQTQLKDTVALLNERIDHGGAEIVELRKRAEENEKRSIAAESAKTTRRSTWQVTLLAATIGVIAPSLIGLIVFAITNIRR